MPCAMNEAAAAAQPPLLACRQLSKTFSSGGSRQTVLNNADFTVQHDEIIAIVGASGSGKTTLLHLLGGLETPDGGSILYNGEDINALNDTALAHWRNRSLAFIFQFHLLLPEFNALENTAMPLLLRRVPYDEAIEAAAAQLAAVNLTPHQHKTPAQLSGGERQRTAIARALVGAPALVLADEPTGSLDSGNADSVMTLLLDNCRRQQTALIIVSHDERLTQQSDRQLTLHDGKLTTL